MALAPLKIITASWTNTWLRLSSASGPCAAAGLAAGALEEVPECFAEELEAAAEDDDDDTDELLEELLDQVVVVDVVGGGDQVEVGDGFHVVVGAGACQVVVGAGAGADPKDQVP